MTNTMPPQSSRHAYLQLLGELASLTGVFLMGGFAEDALLDHGITKDRSDLDLLVEFERWDDLQAELREAGISRWEARFSGPAGEPLAFGSSDREIEVETWLTTAEAGGYAIVLPGGAAGFFRLRLPADTFQFPKASLDGVPVQTISPLALSLFRAASARTRGDRRKRAEDLRILRRLAEEFLPGRDPKDLVPEMREFRAP